MSESKTQAKILKWLKAEGHYSFKTVVCNRAGIPDIIGCTKTGRFFAIEVKYGRNKTTKLQDWNLAAIAKMGGVSIIAYSLEDVQAIL